MARARFIRPEFFTDEKISDLPFGACMLFAGIWCHSDLRGVFEHNPRLLRGLIFPMRDGIDTAAVGKWLEEIEAAGMISRFEADGKTWGQVVNWEKHQQISGREREVGTRRPPPPGHAQACPKRVPSVAEGQDRAASPTPTTTPTPTPATAAAQDATGEPQPPDPCAEIEKINAKSAIIHKAKTWRDWQIMVGTRCFIGKDEGDAWAALYQAEGWDEMTRGYEYLSKVHPVPGKIFLSMFQDLRQ